MQHFEKLEVNLTPESIYIKEECGLKKHADTFCIYIYKYISIYVIMKTMCPPGYHHNGFVATHALGHMMYGFKYISIYLYL